MSAKGSLTLELIGKYVIMLVAVLIAIGLIISLTSDIGSWRPPQLKKDEPRFVQLDVQSSAAQAGKIGKMAVTCYKKMQDTIEPKTCYIVRAPSGDFDISASQINQSVQANLRDRLQFPQSQYNRDSVVISYTGASQKVQIGQ